MFYSRNAIHGIIRFSAKQAVITNGTIAKHSYPYYENNNGTMFHTCLFSLIQLKEIANRSHEKKGLRPQPPCYWDTTLCKSYLTRPTRVAQQKALFGLDRSS